ncbi:ABC transporter permease [Clostridium beijerinckii]|uniref:ABC transport system permease protein n=1 Tax=Clostridium beijerinckii TaxID=1520 RepID=A0A9Q5GKD9_CLOBE|nr:ABC transporter permease [Clostridium beijerinckii]AQS03684.1 ribose ABC transporter permease protein [Clostridium beijerinckii]MBA2887439.1 putative ABC transport system permease protein [Clostridium beijerinckii]MBA2902329.1 putative ABC transport system permease protein [Clostridium beijerinckii]MBA2912152.1 putative ABC transport system permease protein [Clostridium beijerinckii]MBA9016771.1 putative ABC transport system permease protein [Clostridium beijerinckii]
MGVLINILEQGLLFSLVSIGVYITYKILDFPDLSVDSTFPLGAAISAALLVNGVNPWISIIIATLGGALAGGVTAFLHVKLKITNLMAGILVMIGLYSINLRIMGKANVPLFNTPNLFKSSIPAIVVILIMVIVVKILLDLYLKTKSGFLLIAVGDNEQVVSSLGVNKDLVKVLGLMISNALVALAGALTAQYQGFSDVGMGTGTVVMGLAAVIIGTSLFERLSFIKVTTLSILGAIIYKAAIAIVLKLGLNANDLKLMTAIIVVIALCSNSGAFKFKKRKSVIGGSAKDVKSETTIQSV